MQDERFTYNLVGDVFKVLEAHGYKRGDARHRGQAIGILMDLVEAFEKTGE